MTTFEIIKAKPYHCGQMARRLRTEHASAVVTLGMQVHHELVKVYDMSWFRRAWLVNGELAALGGVTGTGLSTTGYVWLAIAQSATRYPKAIIREARKQLAEIMSTHHEIITTIIDRDETSKRFALALGFVPTQQIDPHQMWLMVLSRDEQERPWPSRLH